MNIKNHTHRWTIDDVLNPKSKFWGVMYKEIEMYLDSAPSEEICEIDSEPFCDKISDFINYFKTISPKNTKQLIDEIENAEETVTNVLWNLINDIDKEFLFYDDINYFGEWIDICPKELLDIYIKLLASDEPISTSKPDNIVEVIRSATKNKNSCNVSIHNGRLILCSTNHGLLKKFKASMVDSGNIKCEYRKDTMDKDLVIHSYIFDIKTPDKL